MLSVAVIGAGPAGLVTAKTLLHSHPAGTFQVSIFEQSSRIGGLWATDAAAEDGLIDPEMQTNISKFSVAFSDLSWESISLGSPPGAGNACATTTTHARIYPKAWQVNCYLQEYYKKFVPANVIAFNTRVTRIERHQQGARIYWKVTTMRLDDSHEFHNTFDHVIIASGFYSPPRMIDCELDGFVPDKDPIRIIHNSQFRKISDLSVKGKGLKGGKVLVVGGSYSGGDVAASIAFHMSNDRHSPSGDGSEPVEIIHVMPHPLYAIPPFVQAGNEMGGFVPLDLSVWDLAKRPPGPISFSFTKMSAEKANGMRSLFESLLYGSNTQMTKSNNDGKDLPPFAVVSDSYNEFVRSGAISPMTGRLIKLTRQHSTQQSEPRNPNMKKPEFLSATVVNGSNIIEVENIAAVVYGTGYKASRAFNFLSDELKQLLNFDASYPRLPILLEKDFVTYTAALPGLAFVGCVDANFWGVLEMQARITARRWASGVEQNLRVSDERSLGGSLNYMREFRDTVSKEKSTVQQALFDDYVGFMEQASQEIGLERIDLGWNKSEGPICAARYIDAGSDQQEARKTMANLREVIDKVTHQGAFVARAAFHALLGKWKLQYKGFSGSKDPLLAESFSAYFHPRIPTNPEFDSEYLYIERSSRGPGGSDHRLVYRYNEIADKISIWSVNEDNLTADTVDYALEFDSAGSVSETKDWLAKGKCASAADNICSTYSFRFSGVALQKFSIETFPEHQSISNKYTIEFTRE